MHPHCAIILSVIFDYGIFWSYKPVLKFMYFGKSKGRCNVPHVSRTVLSGTVILSELKTPESPEFEKYKHYVHVDAMGYFLYPISQIIPKYTLHASHTSFNKH